MSAFWYTAEEIQQNVKNKLDISPNEAFRWLKEGIDLLSFALINDDLERCLQQPTTSINTKWDTFVAASLRYKLRVLGFTAPQWTFKAPLDQLWFPSIVIPERVDQVIALTPTELKRVGIMLPETALV